MGALPPGMEVSKTTSVPSLQSAVALTDGAILSLCCENKQRCRRVAAVAWAL